MSTEGPLLEGHMNFAVELLSYHKPEHKYFIGSKPAGMQLIEVRWAGLHFVGVVIDASLTLRIFFTETGT